MTLTLSLPVSHEMKPRITVVGVGGAGGNAVNNMITSHLEGVEFIACNTDAQALGACLTDRKIQLGSALTHGLGAGARPEVGCAAAQESLDEILDQLQGSHMVFITAGMGGGTGTGAAPVVAQAVREQGILTVGVVTKPFQFEGAHRMRLAEQGLLELQKHVDTLIVIPNQNLFRLANEKTTFADAFQMADEVLHMGVRGVTDLMIMPGLINLDFADIRTVMSEMGKAMMGTGEAEGENRAIEAAEAAISNPLLDEVSMQGAAGVLINITGGGDMTLFEVDAAANRIREEVEGDANIIFGSTFDTSLDGRMRVSVVATGIESEAERAQMGTVSMAQPAAHPATKPQEAGGSRMFRFQQQPNKLGAPSQPSSQPQSAITQLRVADRAEPSGETVSASSYVPEPAVSAPYAPNQQAAAGPVDEKRGSNIFERVRGLASFSKAPAQAPSIPQRRPLVTADAAEKPQKFDATDELADIPAFLRKGGGQG